MMYEQARRIFILAALAVGADALLRGITVRSTPNILRIPGALTPCFWRTHMKMGDAYRSGRRSAVTMSSKSMPRIQSIHFEELANKGYTVINDFLPDSLQQNLRDDVSTLRKRHKFKQAKIGQDATNTLDRDIRVAETCFIGPDKLQDVPCLARSELYDILSRVRDDLSGNPILNSGDAVTKGTPPLDKNLDELLYAFYPQGGFYRRHVDAIPESASVLRCYSLLLYINAAWKTTDGGQLRLYGDRGGFKDVLPEGGTLVLFKSDMIPHEVLDTNKERAAVVGWYNRGVLPSDVASLAPKSDMVRAGMLVASALLVTAGLGIILFP